MGSMKQRLAQRNRLNSSRPNVKVSQWISRRACELNSAWLTEGREKMRKAAIFFSVVMLSGLGAMAATDAPKPADKPRTMEEVIDRVITNENRANQQIKQFSPLVETYIQNLKPDKDLGYAPAGDKYFLGRADFSKGVSLVSLTDTNGKGKKIFGAIGNFFSFAMQFLPDGFLQMIFIDTNGFDKQHYKFDYVRREFLGEVRCLVFDVSPQEKSGKGRFLGRMWVEDQDYNVVRFNGAYGGAGHSSWYFHFDSWRTNVQPGLWMPSFIYSEEKELSRILVETPVQDDSKTSNDLSPIQAQRSWDRQAEDNVIDRLERIGLIAPRGEVDKALDTVINNLEVTNNIDLEPDVRCRVMMTSTLESFTVGHTIVMSRGLIDVVPDEASLATMLAHELSHAILGHRIDSSYAFFDQLLIDDKETFRHFGFARTPDEERAANTKAVQLLNNSPYKNQLGNAGLFLTALGSREKEIPNLISPHLGDRVPIMADLKSTTPVDQKQNPQMIAALPIGGRVKVDSWNDKLELIKSKPVGTVAEREKMPFEVTPFMPYLMRYGAEASKPIAASAAATPADPKTGQSAPGKP